MCVCVYATLIGCSRCVCVCVCVCVCSRHADWLQPLGLAKDAAPGTKAPPLSEDPPLLSGEKVQGVGE